MIVGVDLGKTGCRARSADAADGAPVEGPGAPGLAETGGVDAAVAAVGVVVAQVGVPTALCVGAAGAGAAPDAARRLAHELARRYPGARVAVTSDSVASHAGALAGRPGSVLAVGTGTVALAVTASGRRTQLDGWGPWLGDDGGGAWIGREALRGVLLAREGRGPATSLTGAAEQRYGDLAALPATLAAGATARATAAFAPDVVAAADAGDTLARDVLDRAVSWWAELAAAAVAAAGEPTLAVVGGLADVLHPTWPAGVTPVAAAGTALEGALLLAGRTDLPHEAAVVRVTGAGTATDVDLLATEQVRPDLADLDARTPDDLVGVLLAAEATVPAALAAARPALARAVELASRALDGGGRIVYVGAGTPGRLGATDAAECPPTFGVDPDRVVAVCAGGDEAATTAVEGAEDDADAGRTDLAALDVDARDVVVGITASGRTPYVLAALAHARDVGAATVAVVNNPASEAAATADVAVELLTGAEVLGGSTRLKAGSAQKVALNVISTGAMVGSGHTYGAWMVDVMASNEKLRRRARRILREATGVTDDVALAALDDADGRTKTALVALLGDVDAATADRLLDVHGGRARLALAALTAHEDAS